VRPYFERDGIVLYHGRCEDVLPMLPRLVTVIADPPYGIGHDTDYTRFTGGVAASFSRHAPVAGDDERFDPSWLLNLSGNVILFGANCFSDRLPLGSWLVWDKRSPGGGKNVMSDGEAAWWSRGHGLYLFAHTWDGFNRASERGTAHHPCQKPIALMRWVIGKTTKPGDFIFDPYMGSGPIAAAAQQMGRCYIGCEVEERYVAIAARRLSQSVMPLTTEVTA